MNPFEAFNLEPHEKKPTGNLRWSLIKASDLSGFPMEPPIPVLEQEWEFRAERKDHLGDTWVREGKYWESVPFRDSTVMKRGKE